MGDKLEDHFDTGFLCESCGETIFYDDWHDCDGHKYHSGCCPKCNGKIYTLGGELNWGDPFERVGDSGVVSLRFCGIDGDQRNGVIWGI